MFCSIVFLAICATSKGLAKFYLNLFWSVSKRCGLRHRRKAGAVVDRETRSIVFTSVIEIDGMQVNDERFVRMRYYTLVDSR